MAIKRLLGYRARKYRSGQGHFIPEVLDEGCWVPLLNVIVEYLLEPSTFAKAGDKLFVAKFMPQHLFELFCLSYERLRDTFKKDLDYAQLQWVPAGQLCNGSATLLYGVGTKIPPELHPLFNDANVYTSSDKPLFDGDDCLNYAISVPAQVDWEAMVALRYLGYVPNR